VWAEDVGVTEPTASAVFCPTKINRGTDAAHALQSRLGYGSPNLFSRRSFVYMRSDKTARLDHSSLSPSSCSSHSSSSTERRKWEKTHLATWRPCFRACASAKRKWIPS